MFLNKFLLIGSGVALAGTRAGLGVYYGVNGTQEQNEGKSGQSERNKQLVASDRKDTREQKVEEAATGTGKVK